MARNSEILTGLIALIIFTFVDILLYLVSNAIMGPVVSLVNTFKITPLLGMADNTYTMYVIWAFLLLFEIAAIISFVYIAGRRQINGIDI